jgi:hypothetical protein
VWLLCRVKGISFSVADAVFRLIDYTLMSYGDHCIENSDYRPFSMREVPQVVDLL